MISCLIIRFWNLKDREINIKLSMENFIELAWLELFMFGFQAVILGSGSTASVVLTMFGSVYMCSTAVIDYLTGYVYCISHFIMLVFILILGMAQCDISLEYCIFTVIYLLFLGLCESAGAFSHGDSEYLAVSYIYFGCSTIGRFALEYMLVVMLMSALVFGIFRKCRTGKEVCAFTPFIVFSEYIIIFIFRLFC